MMGNNAMLLPPAKSAKKPRDYQKDVNTALFDYFEKKAGHPLIVIPTGGGKSLCLAEFIREAHARYPGTRIIVLSHVAELLKQDAEAIIGQCPDIDLTFCSAKIGKKDLTGQVVVASIQSVFRHAFDIIPTPDLVIIDEAHLLSDKDMGMYRKFVADLKTANPHIKIIGFTATPFRAKTGLLHKGENALFTDIAYKIGILDLIEQGYLVPVSTPSIHTRMDTAGVQVVGGDYVGSQLEKAVDKDEITKPCVDEMLLHGNDRKCWLIFTAGIEHCLHVRDEIRSRGISCEMVTGKTPTMERNEVIRKHKSGEIRALVNVGVLTTGYDAPHIDLIAFMRPTRSPVLYIQMMGRAMRPALGKEDAICLDFGSVVETLGPIDCIRLPTKKKGKGEAPSKICPECKEENHAAARMCIQCGFEFPEPELKIVKQASDAAVLSTQLRVETYPVSHVSYYRHQKEGKPDSLRVEYMCGLSHSFREWVCVQHSGTPRTNACLWWHQRSGTKAPNTVKEALERIKELKAPKNIKVKKVGKYFEIVGAEL